MRNIETILVPWINLRQSIGLRGYALKKSLRMNIKENRLRCLISAMDIRKRDSKDLLQNQNRKL